MSNKRQEVSGSLYAAHIGAYGDFLKKFEPLVDVFDSMDSKLVFITDGASWIRLWQSENYPKALQILDFTHGTAHISDWLELDLCIGSGAIEAAHRTIIEKRIKQSG